MRVFQVDAFTNEIFKGNPAAVCLFVENEDDAWLQNMAKEMNLSETAFLNPFKEGFNLRWFTPAIEVDLCGHATLAAAHVLWETRELSEGEEAIFYSLSGVLKARKLGEWIELDFPAEEETPTDPPKELLEALGVQPSYVGRNRFDYLVVIDSEQELKKISPNMELLKKLGNRGLIVTSKSENSEFDFVSRFFAPGLGIDEDPVTGSAHCCLAPYWSRVLNKTELVAYQASRRGGVLN